MVRPSYNQDIIYPLNNLALTQNPTIKDGVNVLKLSSKVLKTSSDKVCRFFRETRRFFLLVVAEFGR